MLDYTAIMAFASALPGAEESTYYGKPAIKVNGRAIVAPGHEAGSFCLLIDRDTVDMLKETDPATFWQTPHYEVYGAVLVRFDTPDPDRVQAMIERAADQARAAKPPRARKA